MTGGVKVVSVSQIQLEAGGGVEMQVLVMDKGCTKVAVPDDWEIGGFAAISGRALLRFVLPDGKETMFEISPARGTGDTMSRKILRHRLKGPSSKIFTDGQWPTDPREAGVQSVGTCAIFGATSSRPIDLSQISEGSEGHYYNN